MEAFLHQIFSGLSSGVIYGSVALALVMIYQATHHINFAQGEMATFSTFVAWALIQAGWPYWGAFFFTLALSFMGGLLVQRLILRPVEKAPVLTNVIVFIGLVLIFNALSGWIFDHTIKSFPSPFPKNSALASKYFSAHDLGSVAVMLAVVAALFAFFRFTPIGLAMRAAAQNPDSARLVGIRVSWMLALGWGLASAIGARLLGDNRQVAEALRRRHLDRDPGTRLAEHLLGVGVDQAGLDAGRVFVGGVVQRAGHDGLIALFAEPDRFPTDAELVAPGLWLARIGLAN